MTDEEAIQELYGMVQEGKRLLQQWQRTSYLNKAQKRQLRGQTKMHLRHSSTRIMLDRAHSD